MIDATNLQQLLITAAWALPLVTGIVEVVKKTVQLPERWTPATAVAVGVGIGLLVVAPSVTGAVVGLILGLGATGLWEFGKITVAGKTRGETTASESGE